jgi:hypothetical protein
VPGKLKQKKILNEHWRNYGFRNQTKAELTLVSVGRGTSDAAPHNFGFHKSVFTRLPRVFNQLAGSIIYPHLD